MGEQWEKRGEAANDGWTTVNNRRRTTPPAIPYQSPASQPPANYSQKPYIPYQSPASHFTSLHHKASEPTLFHYFPPSSTSFNHKKPNRLQNHHLLLKSNHHPTIDMDPPKQANPQTKRTYAQVASLNSNPSHPSKHHNQSHLQPPHLARTASRSSSLILNARNSSRTSSQISNTSANSRGKRKLITRLEYKPLSASELTTLLKWLPFQPNKDHPAWKGRCHDCFVRGHEPGACQGYMVCHNCKRTGHRAKDCTNQTVGTVIRPRDLQPQGPAGDRSMPANRPELVHTFVHETPNLTKEISRLRQAIVVDTRLLPEHHSKTVMADFRKEWEPSIEGNISKTGEHQYLIVLPSEVPRYAFLAESHPRLADKGYVWFPWSPSVAGPKANLQFRVWIRLHKLPPFAWSLEFLTYVTASFGLIIDHGRLDNRISIEHVDVLVATPELSLVPKMISFSLLGIAPPLTVDVLGWKKEPFYFDVPDDTTPPDSIFVEAANHLRKLQSMANKPQPKGEELNKLQGTRPHPFDFLSKDMDEIAISRKFLKDWIDTAPPETLKSFFVHYSENPKEKNSKMTKLVLSSEVQNGVKNAQPTANAVSTLSNAQSGKTESLKKTNCQLDYSRAPAIWERGEPSSAKTKTHTQKWIPKEAAHQESNKLGNDKATHLVFKPVTNIDPKLLAPSITTDHQACSIPPLPKPAANPSLKQTHSAHTTLAPQQFSPQSEPISFQSPADHSKNSLLVARQLNIDLAPESDPKSLPLQMLQGKRQPKKNAHICHHQTLPSRKNALHPKAHLRLSRIILTRAINKIRDKKSRKTTTTGEKINEVLSCLSVRPMQLEEIEKLSTSVEMGHYASTQLDPTEGNSNATIVATGSQPNRKISEEILDLELEETDKVSMKIYKGITEQGI